MKRVERKQFTREDRLKILAKTSCKCGHCGKDLSVEDMTVDHVFPLYKGGTHDEYNLIALCYDCNEKKSNWIYSIFDFYRYILSEHKEKYYFKFNELSKAYRKKSILGFDAKVYKVVPDKQKLVIYNMYKRGTKKSKVFKYLDSVSVKIIMDKAYDGDAEDILKLIEKTKDKSEYFNTDFYSNSFDIVNDIRSGEVYVLRCGRQICGVIAFKKFDELDISLPQLNNIEETTRLMKKYVMTLACVSSLAGEILPDVLDDIYSNLIRVSAIPIYFNILSKLYRGSDKDFISIPYSIDGINGNIEFFTTKYIINRHIDELKEINKYSEDSEDLEKLTDDDIETLSDSLVYEPDNLSMYYRDEDLKKSINRLSKNRYIAEYMDMMGFVQIHTLDGEKVAELLKEDTDNG